MASASFLLRGFAQSRQPGLLFVGAAKRWRSHPGVVSGAPSGLSSVPTTPRFCASTASDVNEAALEAEREKRLTIMGGVGEDVSCLSGVPDVHVKHRRVRIFIPAKNAMQSGTNTTHKWRIEFDTWERWQNNLMGWCSTGDPLSNQVVEFYDLEDAIAYCERNRWTYDVDEPQKLRRLKKSYGANYAWNKRTRTSAK